MQAYGERLEHDAVRGQHRDAPRGLVWIKSAPSVASVALLRALKEIQAYRGALPAHATPSVIVYCCDGVADEDVGKEVSALSEAAPHSALVVLSASASLSLAHCALRAGARGFLHAQMSPKQIAYALCLAEEGEVVLPRELLEAAVSELRGQDLSKLKPRQRQILELVAEGLQNAQIARRLWLSESTVKQHLRAAYKLLEVRNRVEAAAMFRRGKLLGLDQGEDQTKEVGWDPSHVAR